MNKPILLIEGTAELLSKAAAALPDYEVTQAAPSPCIIANPVEMPANTRHWPDTHAAA
jgi:hypothetical protein